VDAAADRFVHELHRAGFMDDALDDGELWPDGPYRGDEGRL
jgi:hypothetical protein